MNVHEAIERKLDMFEAVQEQWLEWCLECKHAYRKKGDADNLWCRLRKRQCPHLAERKEE